MHRTRFWKFALVTSAVFFAVTYRSAPVRAQGVTAIGIPADDSAMTEDPSDGPLRRGLNQRSPARLMGDALLRNVRNGGLVGNPIWSGKDDHGVSELHEDTRNVQVNDAALDHIVSFPGVTRPFEFSTQSETSVAAHGEDIVVGYNSSANQVVQQFPQGLFFTKRLLTAYSVSHDRGRTWTSGFVPPAAGSQFTFGDPSLAVDRRGNFYYASLAADAHGNTIIIVNKSSDGSTFGVPTIAATDNGGDKDWLAVGPDPMHEGRDNLYVTWTSFAADGSGSSLWLSRSTDGGASWIRKQLFAPTDNGTNSSAFIQFSNPVVDASTGRLYIPFLHFSDIDADAIQVLVSDNGGDTFRFLSFNVAGWPDPTGFPTVTPGEVADCGQNNGGLRNVLHQGSSVGGGRFGFPRYVHATRLVTQPAAAAADGRLLIAFQSSTSPFFGDPTAGSTIKLLYSLDGGNTWAPTLTVAASTGADPQHVHPAIALDEEGRKVFITYYTQQADTRLRTDVATGEVDGNHVELNDTTFLSTTAFDITPSNVPHPIVGNPFFTTNYDRSIVACYNIGEYMSVAASEDGALAAWGDNRNSWTGPPDSAFPGKHAQADVFFSRGGEQ